MLTFLPGGGQQASAVHEAFVPAATGPVVVFVLDEGADTDPLRWSNTLAAAGARELRTVVVSPSSRPSPADLDGAAGVYVAGGLTPGYHAGPAGSSDPVEELPRALRDELGGVSVI